MSNIGLALAMALAGWDGVGFLDDKIDELCIIMSYGQDCNTVVAD